jgi:hypothetical protein
VVGTIITYLNPRINISVDDLSKLFLKCLPDSFSSPIQDYIQTHRTNTYKTALVSGRYLYKAEAWNLKMSLMILEAFMTYSLKRITELQIMLSRPSSNSTSGLLRVFPSSLLPFLRISLYFLLFFFFLLAEDIV